MAQNKTSSTRRRSHPREPFWKTKRLDEMTKTEWESLCDGCGRCCLNKFEDVDCGRIHYTDVACKLLDGQTCKCSDYENRTKIVRDCIVLTPDLLPEMTCLPPTCAYRVLFEGGDLEWWHPLVSGSAQTVHEAGISVQGRTISEKGMSDDDIYARIVRWPKLKRARLKSKTRKKARK